MIGAARYAKGQKAVKVAGDGSGFKDRAARLAGALNGRFSNRESAYIMSPTKAKKLQVLYDAGAIVSHPGCGSCAQGQLGMIGTTEVQISTGNRNFKGKQGLGKNYLASPATAAVSSLAGYIKAVDY